VNDEAPARCVLGEPLQLEQGCGLEFLEKQLEVHPGHHIITSTRTWQFLPRSNHRQMRYKPSFVVQDRCTRGEQLLLGCLLTQQLQNKHRHISNSSQVKYCMAVALEYEQQASGYQVSFVCRVRRYEWQEEETPSLPICISIVTFSCSAAYACPMVRYSYLGACTLKCVA